MHIALLGGAFNPPHFGHLQVSQQVLDFTDTDEVWLMPCYSHPFDKKMNSAKHRLAMTRLCTKGENRTNNLSFLSGGCRIKVSNWEIRQKKISYSINTLKELSQKFAPYKFSFIIGSENVKDFKKWKAWQQILKKYKVWVFPRAGFIRIELLPGMKLVKNKFLIKSDLSSTKIRQRAGKRLNLKYFVPEKVREYIRKNNLYK